MRSGMYFSPAEFVVMLDLAGDELCTILSGSEEPDDAALTQALASLFRRGLIRWEKNMLVLSEAGGMFRQMRGAACVVIVSKPQQDKIRAVCYLHGKQVWMVEPTDAILKRQYRVRLLGAEELKDWLFSTGLLSVPALREEDTMELRSMLEETLGPSPEDALLRLEKWHNGGTLMEAFELCRWEGHRVVTKRSGNEVWTELYTAQAMERMLEDCFWRKR